MYERMIDEYIESKHSEMLEDLKALMVTDSSLSEASEGKPFGEGAAEVMGTALKMLDSYGFNCRNYENYVITADMNDGEKALDILAHLDVVPAGEGWSVTEAFTPLVKDGKIFGRGSADDKGPAIAAIYAMRAIKDLNIPLSKNVRLILGGCEECGSKDIEYYYSKEPEAPASFSPDADFPVINTERGITDVFFSADIPREDCECYLTGFSAGVKRNMIPACAVAEIVGVSAQKAAKLLKDRAEGMSLSVEAHEADGHTVITVNGEGGHSSTPECARNALTGMLELLTLLPLKGEAAKKLCGLSGLFPFGAHHGESAGIDIQDEQSGRITASLNMLSLCQGHFEGVVDCRVPVCGTRENCAEVLIGKFESIGFNIDECTVSQPHCVPGDSYLVKTLLSSYEKITGKCEKPISIGGGTYAHELKNGVAFGCAHEDVDNRMHGPDEFMLLSVLFESARIFADAIIKLCK